jgi:hypothetical protein
VVIQKSGRPSSVVKPPRQDQASATSTVVASRNTGPARLKAASAPAQPARADGEASGRSRIASALRDARMIFPATRP